MISVDISKHVYSTLKPHDSPSYASGLLQNSSASSSSPFVPAQTKCFEDFTPLFWMYSSTKSGKKKLIYCRLLSPCI